MTSGPDHTANAINRLWPEVIASPELHLHQLDVVQQAGLFVQMPAGAYRTASFLDGRSFSAETLAGWIPFHVVRDTVLSGPVPGTPLNFIFHMGHTGSTLLSRLLDETGAVQPLREPLVLRDLAAMHDHREDPASLVAPQDLDAWDEIMLRLWARCREGQQCAVLKATSNAARIASALMTARPFARAVYLSMARQPYLAVILAGPASLMDVRGHAQERMRRLIKILGPPDFPLHALSPGELVALSWVVEALTREHLRTAVGDRLLTLDFDHFLEDMPASMAAVLAHFGLPGGTELADRIARSPTLGQYAKAPEHAYSSQLRADVIRRSMQHNRTEIARGLALLDSLGKEHGRVAELLNDRG
jgi:hypothetical protein